MRINCYESPPRAKLIEILKTTPNIVLITADNSLIVDFKYLHFVTIILLMYFWKSRYNYMNAPG